MMRIVYCGAAVAIVALGSAMSAKAGIVDNTSLADPPGVYFGNGNANSNFTVATDNGIELGLSAITRFIGPITPIGSTYDVPTGATANVKGGAAWGVDFSINLHGDGGALNLTDITAEWSLTDVGTGKTGGFNPLLIPDNATFGTWAAQNSEALSFDSVAVAFGDDNAGNSLFDENANDTYIFTLEVLQGNTVEDSDSITVKAGTGAPVPEPASLALLGTALLGLAAARRRRKS